ncbi:hypothetical protein SCLCIDRAFT_1151111, partial [Scleroderma citrinum Foug A]
MAEFVYNSINNLSEGWTIKQAIKKLSLESDKDVLPGLEVRLLPHQLISVSWMVDQEKISPHKGGILAYVVLVVLKCFLIPLGKTVQMIATMAANLPEDSPWTTLIVVPSALLFEWKEEIETKTNNLFTIHVHHGCDKLMTTSNVKSKDVIITTYQTLSTELSIPTDVGEGEELHGSSTMGLGVLSRVKWYRIVLDEAHFIRNRGTVASCSVALLCAHHHCMLTGTPVTNTLANIYGLIRFGRFRPWNDWKDFNQYIAKQQRNTPPLAAMRAQEILKPLLLCWTKNAMLDGKPILQLPPKHIDLVTLEFSTDERQIYDNFKSRSHIRINRYIKARMLLKKYVMILRLRQLCCHPNLILISRDYEDPTLIMSDDKEKEHARAVKLMGTAWVNNVSLIPQLISLFLMCALANEMFIFLDELGDEEDSTCPQCKDHASFIKTIKCMNMLQYTQMIWVAYYHVAMSYVLTVCWISAMLLSCIPANSASLLKQRTFVQRGNMKLPLQRGIDRLVCKKMCDLTLQKVFKSSAFEPDKEELQEAACASKHARRSGPSKPEAWKQAQAVSVDSDEEDNDSVSPVKSRFRGRTPLGDSSDKELPDFSQLIASKGNFKKQNKGKKQKRVMSDLTSSQDELDLDDSNSSGEARHSQAKSASGGKGKEKAVSDNDKEPIAPLGAVLAVWGKGDNDLEPSAKMLALVNLLKEADDHGDKTICFLQWTSMLDLVEILLSRYGIQTVRYDGKMDCSAHNKALVIFKRYDRPKVILISTRCGGVGLNLVTANHIV